MCIEHTEFLHKEFHDMILKSQWVVLLTENVAHLLASPPQVMCHSKTNDHANSVTTQGHRQTKTHCPIAPLETVQFLHALD